LRVVRLIERPPHGVRSGSFTRGSGSYLLFGYLKTAGYKDMSIYSRAASGWLFFLHTRFSHRLNTFSRYLPVMGKFIPNGFNLFGESKSRQVIRKYVLRLSSGGVCRPRLDCVLIWPRDSWFNDRIAFMVQVTQSRSSRRARIWPNSQPHRRVQWYQFRWRLHWSHL